VTTYISLRTALRDKINMYAHRAFPQNESLDVCDERARQANIHSCIRSRCGPRTLTITAAAIPPFRYVCPTRARPGGEELAPMSKAQEVRAE